MQERSTVERLAPDLAREAPPVEDEDPVAEPDQLGQLRRAEEQDAPLGREPPHDREDLALRADVDASRRVVQQDDPRFDLEPLADDDLLLVSARQLVDRRPRRRRLDLERGDLAL